MALNLGYFESQKLLNMTMTFEIHAMNFPLWKFEINIKIPLKTRGKTNTVV
jgi:hypothetical protein